MGDVFDQCKCPQGHIGVCLPDKESMGARINKQETTITEAFNKALDLDDLRWLVEQTEGLPGTAQVIIKAHKTTQFDWDPASITVRANL